MDWPKIITWIFAGIGGLAGIVGILAGLLYMEEWWRNKYPKKRGAGVIAESPKSPTRRKLRTLATVLIGLSIVGFMISGSFWVSGIEGKIDNSEKEINGSITNLQSEIAGARELNHAKFNCTIDIVELAIVPPQNKSLVIAITTIINSGAPSVARDWFLKAKVLSGEILTAQALIGITNSVPPTAGIALTPENNLASLFIHTPMANGSAMDGWVGFAFERKYLDELNRPGVVFTLSFHDKDGALIEAVETNVLTFYSGPIQNAP